MKLAPIFACLALVGAAQAQEADFGQEYYQMHCAVCHGSDARGGGPFAEALRAEVPSLTTIADRNDGTFPLLDVIQTIDGRTGVRGHGGPMPLYGGLFRSELEPLHSNAGAEALIRGRTLAIAEYLMSIQE